MTEVANTNHPHERKPGRVFSIPVVIEITCEKAQHSTHLLRRWSLSRLLSELLVEDEIFS